MIKSRLIHRSIGTTTDLWIGGSVVKRSTNPLYAPERGIGVWITHEILGRARERSTPSGSVEWISRAHRRDARQEATLSPGPAPLVLPGAHARFLKYPPHPGDRGGARSRGFTEKTLSLPRLER